MIQLYDDNKYVRSRDIKRITWWNNILTYKYILHQRNLEQRLHVCLWSFWLTINREDTYRVYQDGISSFHFLNSRKNDIKTP